MELLGLFIAASNPVLKMLLITALGSYLSLDRVNILGEDSGKNLNTVAFYVFNPALVATNLDKTITYDSMVKLWFMPVNILITFVIGSLLGRIIILLTKPPPHLRGLVLGCCAAGNLGNLFLVIIPAVCNERGSPFGDANVCTADGMGYASLSMAIGAIYLWSYVYNIVRISSRVSIKESKVDDDLSITTSSEDYTELLISSNEISTYGNHAVADGCVVPCTSTVAQANADIQKGAVADKIQYLGEMFMNFSPKALFAPSTTGAIVGFVIGLVPQLRKLLIGDAAPLRVIQDSAFLLGDGAIPSITLILGANLVKGLRGSGIKKSLLISIVVARYIVLPVIGTFVVMGALRFGWVQADPLYQFVLLLQFVLPPAMNIGTITQLFGAGEKECSVIMLWTYALASVSLTLWSTFYMWIVTL